MRPTAFVVMLFVMGAACVAIAIADHSLGWFIGGAVFFAVGMYARGQLKKEWEVGAGPARAGFVGIAMLAMLAAMLVLFLI